MSYFRVPVRDPNALIERIGEADDNKLKHRYVSSNPKQRAHMKGYELSLKASVSGLLTNKLIPMYSHLPYSLLACFAFVLGIGDESDGREFGKLCIDEYEAAMGAGLGHKMHRVANRFLERGCFLRSQFESWLNGTPLTQLHMLFCLLRAYAMIPIVCRRVESVHAWIKALKQRCKAATIPFTAAGVRRLDHILLLECPVFRKWVQARWRGRNILLSALKCFDHDDDMKNWTGKQLLGFWYHCLVVNQFKNLTTTKQDMSTWNKHTKKTQQPDIINTAGSATYPMVKYMKNKFKGIEGLVGVEWTVSMRVWQAALQPPADASAVDTLAVPEPTSELQIIHEACQVLARVSLTPVFEPDDMEVVAFMIVIACPEQKVCVRPAHVQVDSSAVLARVWKHAKIIPMGASFVLQHDSDPGVLEFISLSSLASLKTMPCIIGWSRADRQASLSLPDSVQRSLCAMDTAMTISSSDDIVGALAYSYSLVNEVHRAGSIHQGRTTRWLPVEDLQCGIRQDLLKVIVDAGVIVLRNTRNGDQVGEQKKSNIYNIDMISEP